MTPFNGNFQSKSKQKFNNFDKNDHQKKFLIVLLGSSYCFFVINLEIRS